MAPPAAAPIGCPRCRRAGGAGLRAPWRSGRGAVAGVGRAADAGGGRARGARAPAEPAQPPRLRRAGAPRTGEDGSGGQRVPPLLRAPADRRLGSARLGGGPVTGGSPQPPERQNGASPPCGSLRCCRERLGAVLLRHPPPASPCAPVHLRGGAGRAGRSSAGLAAALSLRPLPGAAAGQSGAAPLPLPEVPGGYPASTLPPPPPRRALGSQGRSAEFAVSCVCSFPRSLAAVPRAPRSSRTGAVPPPPRPRRLSPSAARQRCGSRCPSPPRALASPARSLRAEGRRGRS